MCDNKNHKKFSGEIISRGLRLACGALLLGAAGCAHFAPIMPGCRDRDLIDRFGYSPLVSAAEKGTVEEVERWLRCRANPNQRTYDGRTALFFSIVRGDLAAIELLLKAGADPNLSAYTGEIPLYVAVKEGKRKNKEHYRKILRSLLEAGADPTMAPLLYGDSVLLSLLLESSNLNSNPKLWLSMLEYAIDRKEYTTIALLLKAGNDANRRYRFGHQDEILHPLVRSFRFRHEEKKYIDLFAKHGANLNLTDNRGRTPLFQAGWGWVIPLLEAGTDPEHRDQSGRTAREHYMATFALKFFPEMPHLGNGPWTNRFWYIDRIERFMERKVGSFARRRAQLRRRVARYRKALWAVVLGKLDREAFSRHLQDILDPDQALYGSHMWHSLYRRADDCRKKGGRIVLKKDSAEKKWSTQLATGRTGAISHIYANADCFVANQQPDPDGMNFWNTWVYKNGEWYLSLDSIAAYRGIPGRTFRNTPEYYQENINALEILKESLSAEIVRANRKDIDPYHQALHRVIFARPLADLPEAAGAQRILRLLAKHLPMNDRKKPYPEALKELRAELDPLLDRLILAEKVKAFEAGTAADNTRTGGDE